MHPLFWLYWLASFLIVVSALAILCAIRERWLWKRNSMTAEDRMMWALLKIVIIAVVAIVALAVVLTKAFAHDPVPNGTVIEIPQHKINKDPNPTGRAVVWLSSGGFVWCFVGISGS